jgi:hypothetical protein
MGADDRQRNSRAENRSASELPRYIIEHIGQVLRNRYREDLLIPVPTEMLKLLETPSQSASTLCEGQQYGWAEDPSRGPGPQSIPKARA